MRKLIVSTAIIVASLAIAGCNQDAQSSGPRFVRVEVLEEPEVTDTRCFMRIRSAGGQTALVDFPRISSASIRANQRRAFEVCERARPGDHVAVERGTAGT